MIPEEMTMDQLLDWANSLNVCRFEIRENRGFEAVVSESSDGSISMRLGRFSESLGGMRMVHFGVEDRRDCHPWLGMGYGSSDLGEIANDIEQYAEELGLFVSQMTLL